MVMAQPTSGEGRRRGRGAGPAITISLVLHALVLVAIGLSVPKPQFSQPAQAPPVKVILLPSFEQAHPQAAAPAPGAARGPTAGRAAPEVILPHVHVPPATTAQAPPSPITAPPNSGEAPPGRPGASVAPGPLPYSESDRGVRAFLRATVGCENPESGRLSPEERARCAERFAKDARGEPPFSSIDPAKRGAYAAQAAADEHRRSMRDNQADSPLFVPCGSFQARETAPAVGANLGGGCLPDTAIGHVKAP
jgi:hypothetical protein